MPWLETAPMEQRQRFIEDYQEGFYSMCELCARYGISRRIGYKWLERFADGGRRRLADRSRAPHTSLHRIRDVVAEQLCHARKKHPDWGRRSCSIGSPHDIRTSGGRRRVPRETCSRTAAWWSSVGAGVRINTLASSRP